MGTIGYLPAAYCQVHEVDVSPVEATPTSKPELVCDEISCFSSAARRIIPYLGKGNL